MPDIAFPLDDAFITLHNARVLLTGADQVYGVPALVGATSPAHLALVAAMGQILPLSIGSALISAAFIVIYGAGLWRMALLASGSRLVAALILPVGLLLADGPFQLVNGLETGMAMAAVVWAFVLALEKSRIVLPMLCGVMPFIRPELGLLSALVILTRAARWPRDALRDIALAGVAAAPFLMWIYMSLGDLVPRTAMAKKAYFAESNFPLEQRAALFAHGLASSSIGFAIAVAALIPTRAPFAWAARLFIVGALTALFLNLPGATAHNHSRYLYPLLPAAIYLLLATLHKSKLAPLSAVGLLALTGLLGVRHWPYLADDVRFTSKEHAAVAKWVSERLPNDARLLIHDAGHIAWATQFKMVDLVGLKTPGSIADHVRWTLPSGGRERYLALDQIAKRASPTHLIVLNDPFWGKIAPDLQRAGWDLELLREPEGRGYRIFAIRAGKNQD